MDHRGDEGEGSKASTSCTERGWRCAADYTTSNNKTRKNGSGTPVLDEQGAVKKMYLQAEEDANGAQWPM